jgi:hypothetical protein
MLIVHSGVRDARGLFSDAAIDPGFPDKPKARNQEGPEGESVQGFTIDRKLDSEPDTHTRDFQ